MEERSCDFRRKMGKGGCYRGSNLGCGAVVALGFDVPAGLAQGVGRIEDGLVLGRRQLSGANVLISRLGMALAFGQILTVVLVDVGIAGRQAFGTQEQRLGLRQPILCQDKKTKKANS